MSKAPRTMRSALGRVRNLGASGEGTGHFIAERASSIALIFLGTWFVLSAALTMDAPTYVAAIDFLTSPINAVGVVLLLIAGVYHMQLGLAVIIEDYIAKTSTKVVLLLLNSMIPLAIVAGAIFAVLLVNFGA